MKEDTFNKIIKAWPLIIAVVGFIAIISVMQYRLTANETLDFIDHTKFKEQMIINRELLIKIEKDVGYLKNHIDNFLEQTKRKETKP